VLSLDANKKIMQCGMMENSIGAEEAALESCVADISCLEFEECEDDNDEDDEYNEDDNDEDDEYNEDDNDEDNSDDEEEDGDGQDDGGEVGSRNGMHLMQLLLTLAITNPQMGQMSAEEAAAYIQRRDNEYLASLAAEGEDSERFVPEIPVCEQSAVRHNESDTSANEVTSVSGQSFVV
jgi:ABC-type Zn2+ transport system substrate-binding protein/surface adhesin